MKVKKQISSIENLSGRAMRQQIDSHRIEGITISNEEAEQIRQEVSDEYQKQKPISNKMDKAQKSIAIYSATESHG